MSKAAAFNFTQSLPALLAGAASTGRILAVHRQVQKIFQRE